MNVLRQTHAAGIRRFVYTGSMVATWNANMTMTDQGTFSCLSLPARDSFSPCSAKIGTPSRRVRPLTTKGLLTPLERRKAKRPSGPTARHTPSWISLSASTLPPSLPSPASHAITPSPSQSVLHLWSTRGRVSLPRRPHPIPALDRHPPIPTALP